MKPRRYASSSLLLFHVKPSLRARAAALQRRLLLFLIVVGLAIPGCVAVQENPVSGRKRAYGYTWEQEKELGKQTDQQIIAQYGIYDDPGLQSYVERIGEEVLAESHLRREDANEAYRNTEFTFRVLDSPVINAFALPGGYIYLTRGLLAHLENEAQLAMVLGHEVAHVAARHASARAAKAQLAQVGLIGGAIASELALGGGGAQILDLGGQGLQLLFLSYSRDAEREADQLGVEYSALAHYEAAEGAGFFRALDRIGERQEGGLPSWLSTHPEPEEREENIPRLAERWRGETEMTIVDREGYLERLEGLMLGNNPREGFVEDGVFYHPDLQFRFPVPSGFSVNNTRMAVQMVDQGQQAIMTFAAARDIAGAEVGSPQEAARAFAQQEGLQVVESGAAQAGGLPAYFVLADAQAQGGQSVRALTYFVEYGGTVWGFLSYAAAGAFSNYQDDFLRTMRGFQRLTDSRILNVQPTRMRVVRASRTAPFRSFVPNRLPPSMTAEDLAILNQVELDETIQQGAWIKLPRSS